MKSNFKVILFSLLIIAITLILQSTVLEYISINGIKPDITLIIIIFIAIRRGSIASQISGFGCGLMEDFITGPFLGFHSLIKAIIGFFYGLMEGNIIIDNFFIPPLLALLATIFKRIIYLLIALVFAIPIPGLGIWIINTGIEILYNSLLAPFIFLILKRLKLLKPQKEAI